MRTTEILEQLECYHDVSISLIAFVLGCHENLVWKWQQRISKPTPSQKAALKRFLKRMNNSHQNI